MTTLVEGGTPATTVRVRRGEATPVAGFAAGELRAYVEAMSGATLPVAGPDGTDELPAGVASAVLLAERGGLPEWDAAVADLADARGDAFVLRSVDGGLVCAGTTDRGTLYAVYALLEDLGVRFFAPDFPFYDGHHERVPERETLARSPDRVEAPSLGYRIKYAMGPGNTPGTLPALVDWLAKTRHNVLATSTDYARVLGLDGREAVREYLLDPLERRGLLLKAGGHNFHEYLPPEEHDDHPEWFVDGYNVFDISREGAVEALAESVVEDLAAKPEVDIFDAWPPDGASWPPRTVEAFGSVANAYAHAVTAIREAVRERLERDLTVEAIAYASHIRPPDSEYMYPEDVLVDFAPDGQDRSIAVPTYEQTGEDTDEGYDDWLRAWRESFDGTIAIYEYYRRYAWHSLPVLLPELMSREVPYYDEAGADGIGTYGEPADWLVYELTHLLVARLAWDTDLDVEEWLDGYLEERYGAAAGAVGEYVAAVEAGSRAFLTSQRAALHGDFDDVAALEEGLERYRAAADALDRAREAAEGEAATHLLDGLASNAEYAVVDTELSLRRARGEDTDRARERLRELVDAHRFEGVVLDSRWIVRRLTGSREDDDADRRDRERYREQWPAPDG